MKEEQKEKGSTYGRLSLRKQLFLESRAMAEHALANGKHVSPEIIKTIESYTKVTDVTGGEVTLLGNLLRDDVCIDGLVEAHNKLAKIVEPAKPQTILLLDMEQNDTGFWQFLGAVPLVRQMIVVSVVCLVLFVGIGLSGDVNQGAKSILEGKGLPLLLNLLFYLTAAGLGASFAGLYKANMYITEGTFDTTYNASYWVRFLLGLIAGLIMAVMISDQAFAASETANSLLEHGIIRPLLAILGGFSADLVYTILSRFVETLESLFRGSSKRLISAEVNKKNLQTAKEQAQKEMKVVSNLMHAQHAITGTSGPEEIKKRLDHLIKDVMKDTTFISGR